MLNEILKYVRLHFLQLQSYKNIKWCLVTAKGRPEKEISDCNVHEAHKTVLFLVI